MPQITQLDNDPTPNNNDLLVTVDMAAGTTKNISREQFFTGAPLPANTVDSQAIADGAVTSEKMSDALVPANQIVKFGFMSYGYLDTGNYNLDDFRDTGYYMFDSKTNITNIPGGVNGFLHVISSYQADVGARITKQIWYRWGSIGGNDNDTWVRTANTSTNWGPWYKVSV